MAFGVWFIAWGKIVEDLHAPCLKKCDLIAVCDLREERLAHAKSKYSCEGYQDVDAFLSHSDVQSVIARNYFIRHFINPPITLAFYFIKVRLV